MALELAFLLSREANVLGGTQGPRREGNDACVTSGGLLEARVTWLNIESCLRVPHLQWLMAVSVSQLLGTTG